EFALKRKAVETTTPVNPETYDALCSYYKKMCNCSRIRQFCVDPSCCNKSLFFKIIDRMLAIEDDDD
ncbi:Hypothetical predicted protein, partial [Mytilus galloprovincialis]